MNEDMFIPQYAIVQILKGVGELDLTDCFIILEVFESLQDAIEIRNNAPHKERYIVIPVY